MNALVRAFLDQGTACGNLGSPFMKHLFAVLADNWPSDTALARKCTTFTGDIGPAGQSLPLRIAGGLHALKLTGKGGLSDIYPPASPPGDTFRKGVITALYDHDAFLCDWINSPPQTNELRRSAVLIAGARVAVSHFDLPIHLSELGASGGLNLHWDRIAVQTPDMRLGPDPAVVTLHPDWTGDAPPDTVPVVADRRGVDLMPLDPGNTEDLLRLMAFLWPDQPERLEMTNAVARLPPAPVDQGDAINWLDSRLNSAPQGHLHLIQNTVAWQYFPQEAQKRGAALMQAHGSRASHDRPLAWLQMETDGARSGLAGAAITLQIWPSGQAFNLGRADFHGRWLNWRSQR